MICCKIIADYSNKEASFSKLCESLGKKGVWCWNNDVMYFADTDGSTTEKQVTAIVKRAGYKKMYIDVYDNKEEPSEPDEIKWWIAGKLAKIMANTYQKENQKVLKDTMKCLNEINHELDVKIQEAIKNRAVPEKTEEQN